MLASVRSRYRLVPVAVLALGCALAASGCRERGREAPLDSDHDIPLSDILNQVNSITNPPSDPTCQGNCQPGGDTDFSFDRDPTSGLASMPCLAFNQSTVCSSANSFCQAAHGSGNCWAEAAGSQASRFKSVNLRKKVFGYAGDYFNRAINDPVLQQRCCQGYDSGCVGRFKQVQLYVLMDLGESSATAYYRPGLHRVDVSEAILLNTYNQQGIERLLLHELGHACQASRHVDHPDAENLAFGGCDSDPANPNASSAFNEAELRGMFGAATGDCLANIISSSAKSYVDSGTHAKGACLSSYFRESIADAIFMENWTDLTHWAWDCDGAQDFLHCSTYLLNGCTLNDPRIQKAVCPGGVTPASGGTRF